MSENVKLVPSCPLCGAACTEELSVNSELTSLRAQLQEAQEWIDGYKQERESMIAVGQDQAQEIERLNEVRDALTEDVAWEMNARMEAEERARVAKEKVSVLAQKTGKLERLIEDLQTYRYPDMRTFISQWKDNHQ